MNEGEFAVLVEIACQAHWPSWGRMRPDHEAKWRKKMAQALRAVFAERANARP